MLVDRGENDHLRVQAQQAALFGLLKGGIPVAEPRAAWPALTEALATTLRIRRASVWLFNEDRSVLRLAHEHDDSGNPRPGAELEAVAYPAYFHALLGNRTIVAPDARTDPRTIEFNPYFTRDDVISLLDAGIWREGQAIGVVCAETVGERRDWTTDEQLFAGSIADLAAAVLNHEGLERARAALEESQELFSRALRSSPDWISVVRMSDGVILEVNEAFERESGYRVAEVVGRSTLDIGLWVDRAQRDAWIGRLRRDGLVREHEVLFRKKSGEIRTFNLSGHRVVIHGADCAVTISQDVTERRRHERVVQEIASGVGAAVGETFFRSLVEHLARLLKADLAFVGEIVRREVPSIHTIAAAGEGAVKADQEYALDGTPTEAVLATGVSVFSEGVARSFPRDPALATRGMEAYVGAPLVDSRGKALGILSLLFRRKLEDSEFTRDLIRIFASRAGAELERQQNFRAVHHLAHHDSLTGLPNRLRMRQRLEDDLTALKGGSGKHGALLLIDLDRFKEVNDTMGHAAGDALLKTVAGRLVTAVRQSDLVARLGGDEFVALAADASEVGRIADRIQQNLGRIQVGEAARLPIAVSIGVTWIDPGTELKIEEALAEADREMYQRKRERRGSKPPLGTPPTEVV